MRDRLRRLRRLRPRRLSRRAVMLVAAAAIGIAVLIVAAGLYTTGQPSSSGFTYTGAWTLPELVRHVEAGEVVAISTGSGGDSGTELVALTNGGQHVAIVAGVPAGDAADALRAMGYGRLLTAEAQSLSGTVGGAPSPLQTVFTILMVALLALALVALAPQILRLTRDSRGRRFTAVGRAADGAIEARVPSVRLDEVAGVDEAKTELLETIEFLRNPERFTAVGARPVRGVLLSGPPGTGKTMLAKAVAAEAAVPFLAASGSDFIEKYVGVGARRIRDLFAAARKEGRAVVFVDEIDAIGRKRGSDNNSDERDATLNALLVEMDGFGPNDNVVVLAATNRPDVLDPAILRPGRFTRKVSVPMPDREARLAILRVHAEGKPLSADVDLPAVARKTYGFSGAMLSDL
ncbi:MAG TPA: AAA family ATPase, partial [Candidatus Limnocylindrales bacterium]